MEPTSYELTVEQQFQMRLMEESARNMSQAQLADTLVQASRLIMLKDNVIRSLIKQVPVRAFGYDA
jgi:hypothetical protein